MSKKENSLFENVLDCRHVRLRDIRVKCLHSVSELNRHLIDLNTYELQARDGTVTDFWNRLNRVLETILKPVNRVQL